MRIEPAVKRTVAFFDGQNLYHAAKRAFGYTFPNYDPGLLAQAVCAARGWALTGVRFYTGVPSAQDDPAWNRFWNAKLAVLGTREIFTFSRQLRYQNQVVSLPDGSQQARLVGHEKGIDVRIALDVVRLAIDGVLDVALLFSQDQDLSEVVDEVKLVSQQQGRWIRLACAFPESPTSGKQRGVNGTEWIRIERALYDRCLDPLDHRPKAELRRDGDLP